MTDNPRKKHIDARFVSWQKHEINYVVDQLAEEHPRMFRRTIRAAVTQAKKDIEPSEGRARLMSLVRRRLG